MIVCEARKQVVVSPSTFTLMRGAQQSHECGVGDGEDACIYEYHSYERRAVVPFSWEEKPGVPLIVNSIKYYNTTTIESIKAQRECVLMSVMLSPTIFDHMDTIKRSMCESNKEEASKHSTPNMLSRVDDEKKALAISPRKQGVNVLFKGGDDEKALAFPPPLKHGVDDELLRKDKAKALALPPLKHGGGDEEKALAFSPLNQFAGHMLFPLPPPPKSSLQMLTHNVGAFTASTTTTTASENSSSSTPSWSVNSRTNAHMKKHRARSFPPFLNVNKPTSVSNHVGNDYNELIKEDPFLRAIQACTQPSSVSNNSNTRSDNLVGSAKHSSTTKNSSRFSHPNMGSIAGIEPHSKTYKSPNNVQVAMAKDADRNHAAKSGFTAGNAGDVRLKGGYGAIKAPLPSRPMTEKEVSCKSNLNVNGGSMKAKVYEGHSAFMVAGVQQHSEPKPKKPHIKDHRSTSYGGWLSCRIADNRDSIVRIHNPRSSFS